MFIARGAIVDVAVYEGAASPQAIRGAETAIDRVGQETGRAWRTTPVNANDIGLALGNTDALLIHSQPSLAGGDDALHALGERWRASLEEFMKRGGVVVLLEGQSSHSGTIQILASAGLVRFEGVNEGVVVSDGVGPVVAHVVH